MATNKNLPIKFFQKRQKDEMDTEGGGSGLLPSWVDRDTVGQKSLYIQEVLSGIEYSISEKVKRNSYVPSVVKLKVNEDALAKTYRREIGNLFNIGKLNIIGVSGEDEVLVKIDNIADLQKIVKNLEKANSAFPSNSTVVGISAITNIEEFKPHIDITETEDVVLKIKLLNYGNNELNTILIRAFEKYCRDNHLNYKSTVYSTYLNIYSVTGVTTDMLEELKDFDGIQVVSEMPTYEVTFDELIEENNVSIKQPEEGKEYPIVGILDSGIAKIPHLAPWVHSENITYYVDSDVNKRHGTFVAGVLVYGDELEGRAYTGFEGCKLFEAIVVPNSQISEGELIEQIRDAVSRYSHIKIWNLSLGTNKEADLHEFSDFAKALDEIQDQHDVLICKSAGNCENFKVNGPKGRIAKSADTVRGIVVGSLTHDKNTTDHADKHHASPFSRKGPGPSHLIKPDVVHMGGNAGLDHRNAPVYNTIKSFSTEGGIARQVGTSFSTPRVSAIAAGLHFSLREDFNATLLKALIIHSAKYPEEMKMDIAEKINTTGFGLPSNINDILYNEPNEITLILQDTLER